MSTPYQYHPAHDFTEKAMIEFRDMIQNSLKERKANLEAIEKLPPAPKPARKCKSCGLPLKELAACSVHSKAMRDYRVEFDYSANWSQRLSDATAEEFRLEEREKELLTVAESLKGNRDEDSRAKFVKIMGRDFKSKITERVEHQDGLLDTVRTRLAQLRADMPTLVRAAQAYLDEQRNVPSEGQIFQQRKKEEASARILR